MSEDRQVQAPGLSRRGLLRLAGLTVGGGMLTTAGLAGTARAQAAKVPQKQVHYRTTPKGNAHCSRCAHFLPPSSCAVVQGKISPNGWCSLFAPKL
jgi:hypothetical protein